MLYVGELCGASSPLGANHLDHRRQDGSLLRGAVLRRPLGRTAGRSEPAWSDICSRTEGSRRSAAIEGRVQDLRQRDISRIDVDAGTRWLRPTLDGDTASGRMISEASFLAQQVGQDASVRWIVVRVPVRSKHVEGSSAPRGSPGRDKKSRRHGTSDSLSIPIGSALFVVPKMGQDGQQHWLPTKGDGGHWAAMLVRFRPNPTASRQNNHSGAGLAVALPPTTR